MKLGAELRLRICKHLTLLAAAGIIEQMFSDSRFVLVPDLKPFDMRRPACDAWYKALENGHLGGAALDTLCCQIKAPKGLTADGGYHEEVHQ
jgi:hypothetical protein